MESTQFNYGMLRAKFEPVEDMGNHVNVIRGSLRNRGYTSFKFKAESHDDSFVFQSDDKFLNYIGLLVDQRNEFTLAPTSITFHTRDFSDYDSIVSALMVGLECINNVVSINSITRLDFRNIKPVDSEKGNIWKDYFSYSNEENLGLQKQHANFQQVFVSDFELDNMKGNLTLNVHLKNAWAEMLADLVVDKYSLFDELVSTELDTDGQLDRMFFGALALDHFIESSFNLENDKIDTFFYRLIQKTESVLEAIEQDINRKTNINRAISMLVSEVNQQDILLETKSIPEHIEKIRNVLSTRTYDLLNLFGISERTLFSWTSGRSLPENKKRDLIHQLSKICDQLTEANVKRPDILFRMEYFNGKSLMDIFQSGNATENHVNALIEEDKVMEREYQESGLPNRESKYTSDWKSYLSIPGTIGNY